MKRKKLNRMGPAWLAAAVMVGMIVAACVPVTPAPAPAEPAATAAPAEAEAPAEAPAEEVVELLWWDTWQREEESRSIEGLIDAFEAENPNVQITREVQDFENMKTIVKTALASGTGPDVLMYGTGEGFMGPLVEAGVLLPLDEYAEQYGWRDRIYPWTFESTTFDGNVYALGNELEMIGVYYNKSIFEELGVSPPATYEEFLDIAAKAKEAGYIPIAFANKPGWPAFHVFSAFANNLAGKEKVEAAIFGDGRWDDPDFVRAIEMPFVELNDMGYFIPSPNALEYVEGNDIFYSGQAAMHLTGMWLLSDMLANSEGFEVGFFALPSIEGKPVLPPGGMGSGVMISAATEHPDEAAAFIESLYSDEAMQTWYEESNIIPPVAVDTSDYEIPELFRFFIDTIRESSAEGGLGMGYNIDVYTPADYNTVMKDGFQAVLEGARSPEEQAAALQATKETD